MLKGELALHLAHQTIFLMGISFILGSLCTIFILLILEMVRRGQPQATRHDARDDMDSEADR